MEIVDKNVNPGWYTDSHFTWFNKKELRHLVKSRKKTIINTVRQYKKETDSTINFLDIGCGDGYWLNELSTVKELKLHAFDYNELRVRRAKEIVKNAVIEQNNIFTYTSEIKFDIILFNQVIEHIPDDVGALKKIHVLLKKNGILILGTPNEGSWIQQRMLKKTGIINSTDHKHFYSEKEIVHKVENAGFIIINRYREVFYFFNDKLYYPMIGNILCYNFLRFLTFLFPKHCSDYYFVCKKLTK
jgi:2-polyprenyl-3-methyl-5-hydroxy-6-metoxy-1,4-benzoquinol methylase